MELTVPGRPWGLRAADPDPGRTVTPAETPAPRLTMAPTEPTASDPPGAPVPRLQEPPDRQDAVSPGIPAEAEPVT